MVSKAPQADDDDIPEGSHVTITTKYGDIVIELFADSAPNTVANFKSLIGKGFYDGLQFHRVIDGFMAQGGCPDGTGTGGPGYKIKAEFNDRPHVRGTLAMARASNPDSAGSQFYICYGDTPHLDGEYTVFGQVNDGMDVVDKIQQGDVMEQLQIGE
ncbi:MAG: peptidylprolyl isomerase [Mariprofundales bacterium]